MDKQLSSGGFALGEMGVFKKVKNKSDKEFLLWINWDSSENNIHPSLFHFSLFSLELTPLQCHVFLHPSFFF